MLLKELEQEPKIGTPLGNNCYKVRMSITAKGKGKSGGARVITYLVINKKTIFLIAVYDKSEKSNLTNGELKELLKYLPQ